MASVSVNIVPIMDTHNSDQAVILHPIQDTDTLTQNTLLPGGIDIETLNEHETWTDPAGRTWILPMSKQFPDYIKSTDGFGTIEYISTKENFLDKIIESFQNKTKTEISPLFPYQKFVRDYLKLGTPYRSLLLEHGLGSGKTRSAIEVAKTFRKKGLKTLILTPAFLRLNFMDELEKWEDDKVDIRAHYKFAHYNATGYSSGKKINGKDVGGKGGIFEQLAQLGIGFPKDHKVYGKTFPYLHNKYAHDLKPPEHMLIIIEEAHNLSRSFINTGTSKVKSLLYPLLMMAKDCKFICLSGTPVVSNPFEMAPMYNIMRGYLKGGHTAFPVDENSFNSHFVNYTTHSFMNVDLMMQRMVGLNSYFVGIQDDKERIIFPDRKNIIFKLETTPYQTWMHDTQLDEEIGVKSKKKNKLGVLHQQDSSITMTAAQQELTPSGSYHTRSRAAANFVFPKNIRRPRKGTRDWKTLERYIFEFQNQDGSAAETVSDYEEIYNVLLSEIEIAEDDEEYTMLEWEDTKDSGDINKIRAFISEQFILYFRETIDENYGFPSIYDFDSCLKEEDKRMIIKMIGKYPDRIRMALEELADTPVGKPSTFSLKAMKHYSVKMYTIYKMITGGSEHGAPHLVDIPAVPEKPISLPILNMGEEMVDVDGDTESVDEISDDVDTIEFAIKTSIKEIKDTDDPLIKDKYAGVYKSDLELKKMGKEVRGGPAMVYSYFSSAEGAAIFSMLLQAHGFSNFSSSSGEPGNIPRAKRYAFFRGGMDRSIKKNIIKVFNSKENVNGQLIRVIFVTQAAAEGISLYNVRQIHVMEPHWDNVMIEQVIGRGFRLLAHRYIKNPDDRFITVFRYFTVRPPKDKMDKWAKKHPDISDGEPYYNIFNNITDKSNSADYMIQSIADRKDEFVKKLKDIRIKVAVDCALNNAYNKPKDGCFKYHNMEGLAYSGGIKDDILVQGKVKSTLKKDTIGFIKAGNKSYLYYTNKKTYLEFKPGGTRYEVIKLYGPLAEIPTNLAGYVVPESAMPAGYLRKTPTKTSFIQLGKGKEVQPK